MKVMEIFRSIQGEGIWMGKPTIFVRLAGCNLRCSWCDTEYAQDEKGGEEMPVTEILEKIWALEGAILGHVCITGGEPLLQKEVFGLIDALLARKMHVVLETNGSLDVDQLPCDENLCVSMDVKTPSSGMDAMCKPEMMEELGPADQAKFVVGGEEDYGYALKVLEEHPPQCQIVFTPVGGIDMKWLAEKVLEDGVAVRVLPQLHKLLWGNERKR